MKTMPGYLAGDNTSGVNKGKVFTLRPINPIGRLPPRQARGNLNAGPRKITAIRIPLNSAGVAVGPFSCRQCRHRFSHCTEKQCYSCRRQPQSVRQIRTTSCFIYLRVIFLATILLVLPFAVALLRLSDPDCKSVRVVSLSCPHILKFAD